MLLSPSIYTASTALATLAALALQAGTADAMNLTLAQAYQGASFFDNFIFNASAIDNTTGGNVHYLDRDASTAANLTYINSAGNAIIKVDNFTSGIGDATFGRNSIKLVSNASYGLGTLYVIDAVHLPHGCSVWPALWTLSSEFQSDEGGEIDIWEGVNNVTNAQYTLHTKNGCTQSNNTALPYSGSSVVSTNCFFGANGNQGCAFRDNRTSTYGTEFGLGGGGVFAMLQDANGVQNWFWPRANVPADITAGTPDPDTWGPPTASWPSTTCDAQEYFTAQNIIINITLCGTFAGDPVIYAQTCSGTCTDLIADPRNYDTAYFELASIKTYSGAPTVATITNATQVAPVAGVAGAAKAGTTSSATKSSAAGSTVLLAALAVAAAL